MPIYSLIFTLFSSFPLMVYLLHAMQNYSKQKLTKINHYSSTWKNSAPPLLPTTSNSQHITFHTSFTYNQSKAAKTNTNGK